MSEILWYTSHILLLFWAIMKIKKAHRRIRMRREWEK